MLFFAANEINYALHSTFFPFQGDAWLYVGITEMQDMFILIQFCSDI